MSDGRESSSGDRGSYKESIAPFTDTDVANLRTALNEIGGFAGAEISAALAELGVHAEELKALLDGLESPESLRTAPRQCLLGFFLLTSLVCAALGDEELATITGQSRDAHVLTARRLYHAFARRSG
ncbi:MAG: hypothetical protein QNJ30_26340 [Kiloniellales bacterium]|nr:hypothetical protein [Kiloniellales bacterium]